jgi:ribosomal protein L40E
MASLFGKKAARQKKDRLSAEERKNLMVKRCPECFINLPIDARECYSCHTKIGGIDRFGRAKKRGTWVSYVICLITWAIFIGYIKWAFFS